MNEYVSVKKDKYLELKEEVKKLKNDLVFKDRLTTAHENILSHKNKIIRNLNGKVEDLINEIDEYDQILSESEEEIKKLRLINKLYNEYLPRIENDANPDKVDFFPKKIKITFTL